MPVRISLSSDLRTLAEAQAGVLSRGQFLAHGLRQRVVSRMIADGIFTVMTPGIYSFGPGAGWLSRAWAGVLLGGEGSVLGHESAAHPAVRQANAPTAPNS